MAKLPPVREIPPLSPLQTHLSLLRCISSRRGGRWESAIPLPPLQDGVRLPLSGIPIPHGPHQRISSMWEQAIRLTLNLRLRHRTHRQFIQLWIRGRSSRRTKSLHQQVTVHLQLPSHLGLWRQTLPQTHLYPHRGARLRYSGRIRLLRRGAVSILAIQAQTLRPIMRLERKSRCALCGVPHMTLKSVRRSARLP